MSEMLFNTLTQAVWVQTETGPVELPRAPRFRLLMAVDEAEVTFSVPGTDLTVQMACASSRPQATLFSPVAIPGVLYLVEEHIALALPHRSDLVCPAVVEDDVAPGRLLLRALRRPTPATTVLPNLGDELSDEEIRQANTDGE